MKEITVREQYANPTDSVEPDDEREQTLTVARHMIVKYRRALEILEAHDRGEGVSTERASRPA
ncbi:MAG: hypothetical protein ACR2PL_12430 [Dehalococcoidia bacterium]